MRIELIKALSSSFTTLTFTFMTMVGNAAETDVLTVDRTVSKSLTLAFPSNKALKPNPSDFELINYVLMSNEIGERWAVLTLVNTSTGNRQLEQDHLMALFADGGRKSPLEFKLNFEGNETQSITVSFGASKFPILSITADTEI